jgi:excisionase family DNA binding protein
MDATLGTQLLTIPQVCERLALSKTTVKYMIARRELPGVVRIGGAVRIIQRELDKWIEYRREDAA